MFQSQVAEVQGLYGPFTLSENVVQKIWLQQDFVTGNLKAVSGKKLIVKDPGRWNFQEGPDFKEARLVMDGIEVIGDVEVHINPVDWRYHHHNIDENYDRVLLHVVLYLDSPGQKSQMQTSKGHSPEVLHLLPLLKQDLESYAMEDALLKLERNDQLEWVSRFIDQPLEKRLQILQHHALTRWQQKLAYAKRRLKAEGWESACHSYALEVLGYKRNRSPMLRLAARHSITQMRRTLCESRTSKVENRRLNANRLFDEESDHWKLNGSRPANHPKKRLAQYLEIVTRQPDWPDQLAGRLRKFPAALTGSSTTAFRKAVELSNLRNEISESLFHSIISERRLNTLIVDALLPLGTAAKLLAGATYWQHWFAGDSPDALSHFLKRADVLNRQNPMSNGAVQGALGLFLDQRG